MDFLHVLHHLFASKKGRMKEAASDAEERLTLFERNLEDFGRRRFLAFSFDYSKLKSGKALADLTALRETIMRFQATITDDLTILGTEEHDDEEILAELKRLAKTSTEDIMQQLLTEGKREEGIHALFVRLHQVLMAELRATRSILARLERSQEVRNQLKALYDLIGRERMLYEPFMRNNSGLLKDAKEWVQRLVRSALLEEKFEEKFEERKEEMEDKVARRMARAMAGGRNKWRRIAEKIFDLLLEDAGAPFPAEDAGEGPARFEALIENDNDLRRIVEKAIKSSKAGEFSVSILMKAFREAYGDGRFFDDLTMQFYT